MRRALVVGTLAVALVATLLVLVGTPVARLARAAEAGKQASGDPHVAGRLAEGEAVATFAAGCFWCVQADFDKVAGVLRTTTGYMGGMTRNPTYEEVATGRTGHAEVVQIVFDPKRVSYAQLLEVYWRNTDVIDGRGQFCDRGSAYRPVIFIHDDEQLRLATQGKKALDDSARFMRPVAVQIARATAFTPAEDEHQKFYESNARWYKFYRWGCGRDSRLHQLWGSAMR
jgi:peptide-methionine (S)-S-oxide reductase